jgi:hypothetical protein
LVLAVENLLANKFYKREEDDKENATKLPQPPKPGEPEPLSAWGWLKYAFILYGGAALLFAIFSGIEHTGEGGTTHWLVALLYNLGGKWLVAGLLAALGTYCLAMSVIARRQDQT